MYRTHAIMEQWYAQEACHYGVVVCTGGIYHYGVVVFTGSMALWGSGVYMTHAIIE